MFESKMIKKIDTVRSQNFIDMKSNEKVIDNKIAKPTINAKFNYSDCNVPSGARESNKFGGCA